jgi:membrane associated rhomboid family serine protease
MGYQDREYYREEGYGPSGIDATTMTFKLIIVNVVVYLANILFGGVNLTEKLTLHGDTLLHPLLWYQLLTAGFAHDPGTGQAFGHIFFNMLGLFLFGRFIEERVGPREFLWFYLAAVLFGNLVWAAKYLIQAQLGFIAWDRLAGYGVLGASGAVTAIVILFCLYYPTRSLYLFFLFRVPAWVVGLLIIGSNLLGEYQAARGGGKPVAYEVHLAGALFAFAYWQLHWNLSQTWQMLTGRRGRISTLFRSQPKLRVHDPVDEFDEPWDEELESEADHLLEKVHTHGADSLTSRERKLLEEYSRRVRAKRR